MIGQNPEVESVPTSSESQRPLREVTGQKRDHSGLVVPETNPKTNSGRFSKESVKGAKALQRPLERLTRWELPGKDRIEEYLRDLSWLKCKSSPFQNTLFAICIMKEILP